MKNTILALLGVAAFALAAINIAAQAATPPSADNPSSFLSSVQTYFSSFDTNSTTFTAERGELWTAIDQNPNNLAAILGLTYDITPSWNAEAVMRNASVVGTLVSAQAGGGYAIVHYDAKLTFGLDGGCRFNGDNTSGNTGFAEFYVDARKALTENTYAGVRLYYDQDFTGDNTAAHAPGLMIITGFKF